MRIIPVIDVMHGQVVRAVGGRRGEYRPWTGSKLTDSTDPVVVARAMLEATGATELYAADLDSILDPAKHTGLAVTLTATLPRTQVYLDVGIRTGADWAKLPSSTWRNLIPVIGTETLAAASGFSGAIVTGFYPVVAISIDLRQGKWLGRWEPWGEEGIGPESTVNDIVRAAVRTCVSTLIVIDLARVGESGGAGTEEWVREAKTMWQSPEVIVGGGVRDRDDLRRLEDAGADAVLVASALHDGRLP